MLSSDFQARIASVQWGDYQTAYGNATIVSGQLMRLGSSDLHTALNACNELWLGLCHQHAYVSSAALPACPFMLEVFDVAEDSLRVELLDIFLGFVTCTHPKFALFDWQNELHAMMRNEVPRFRELCNHPNSDIVEIAELILESFETSQQL